MKKTILYTIAAISIAAIAAIAIIGCNGGENSESEGLNKFLGSIMGGSEHGEAEEDGKNGYKVTVVNGRIISAGTGNFAEGDTVYIITEKTINGLPFRGWASSSEDVKFDDPGNQMTSFRMPPRTVTVTANFGALPKYTVTYDGNGNTEGSAPVDPAQYDSGATVKALGYGDLVKKDNSFSAWSTQKNGGHRININETFTITEPTTLFAVWTANNVTTYTVTVVNGTGGGKYEAGETVSVEATKSDGRTFKNWTSTSAAVSFANASASATTFKMPASNVTVTANFETTQTYKVTVATEGTKSYGEGAYAAGTTVFIYAGDAPAGQTFKNWTVNSNNVTLANSNSQTTSFTMPAGAVTVTAVFETAAQQWDGLLDDFEGGTNKNKLGGFWYFYTNLLRDAASANPAPGSCNDKTFTPYVTDDMLERITTAEKDGLNLNFKGGYGSNITKPKDGSYSGVMMFENLREPWASPGSPSTSWDVYPGVGMGTFLTPDTLSGVGEIFRNVTAIKFWMKVSEKVNTVGFKVDMLDQFLPQSNWKDGDYNSKKECPADASYQVLLKNLSTDWKQYTVRISDLKRETWESNKPYTFDITRALRIVWFVQGDSNGEVLKDGMVAVDNIEVEK